MCQIRSKADLEPGAKCKFIMLDALIEGKGLQALVQILCQMLDKTRKVVL